MLEEAFAYYASAVADRHARRICCRFLAYAVVTPANDNWGR